jgi:hypothetical protein
MDPRHDSTLDACEQPFGPCTATNRAGQVITNFPSEFLKELQDEVDYHEANDLHWRAPPMLEEDAI